MLTRSAKLIRYSAASVVTTLLSLALLSLLLFEVSAGWANFAAVGAGSVISFELNRRWVWKGTGSGRLWGKLAVFVAASLTFMLLSTLAATAVASAVGHPHATALRFIAIEATTLAAYGTRWLLQYSLFDRVLFRSAPAEPL
jgi:putative flippase GtrA